MMRTELSKLNSLNREITLEKRRLSELRAAAESCTSSISGLPHAVDSLRQSEDVKITLAEQEALVADRVRESVQEYDRLIRCINSVPDLCIRQILRLRYVDGLSWERVAANLGGGNTADGVRKICTRFLESQ